MNNLAMAVTNFVAARWLFEIDAKMQAVNSFLARGQRKNPVRPCFFQRNNFPRQRGFRLEILRNLNLAALDAVLIKGQHVLDFLNGNKRLNDELWAECEPHSAGKLHQRII